MAASGPEVPVDYCRQLTFGGQLVMPVGPVSHQELIRVLRRGEETYDEDMAYEPVQSNPAPDDGFSSRSLSSWARTSRQSAGARSCRA